LHKPSFSFQLLLLFFILVGMIAQTGSVYLTLCVSIERYVAVCLPLKARSICTFGRARWFVLLIGLFAFLYNIPRFWEVTWNTSFYSDVGNVTTVISTDLREHPMYISVYITWMYLVTVLNMFVLFKMNCIRKALFRLSCISYPSPVWHCSTYWFITRWSAMIYQEIRKVKIEYKVK